jgi:hypothetical protein
VRSWWRRRMEAGRQTVRSLVSGCTTLDERNSQWRR